MSQSIDRKTAENDTDSNILQFPLARRHGLPDGTVQAGSPSSRRNASRVRPHPVPDIGYLFDHAGHVYGVCAWLRTDGRGGLRACLRHDATHLVGIDGDGNNATAPLHEAEPRPGMMPWYARCYRQIRSTAAEYVAKDNAYYGDQPA